MHKPIQPITDRERSLLEALQSIVMETMQYPLQRPMSSDSYLPETMLSKAQASLALYGLELYENRPAMGVAA